MTQCELNCSGREDELHMLSYLGITVNFKMHQHGEAWRVNLAYAYL